MDVQELKLGGVGWVGLAQDKDKCWAILMPCTLVETWKNFI
jgi:hypothetical protein